MIPLSVEFEEEYFALKSGEGGKPSADAYAEQCRAEFCASEGPPINSLLPRVIKTGFKELNMINFITSGHDEVRRWGAGAAGEGRARSARGLWPNV